MILRKPYAFLIKNFKWIHLVVCVLMIYLVYKSSNILSFFHEYIATASVARTSFSLAATYINIYMFFAAILVAGIALAIYILMRQKKKPRLMYFVFICFYLGLIIYFFQIYGVLEKIQIAMISPRDLRIVRDIASVVVYVQYATILLTAIRAVGFNIKQFNFGEDLAELEINVSDYEEFELTVGLDQAKIKRRIRRGKRELKYFIVENLFVLLLLSFIVITSLTVIIFLNIYVYNKFYEQSESFKAGYFVNQINNVYYTHLNQKGNNIAPKGKAYVVTNVTFSNIDIYPHDISLDDINLTFNQEIFSPIIMRYQSFIDLGEGYIKQVIPSGSSKTFIFVFEVNENVDFNDLIFRYRESLIISNASLEAKYKKVKIKAVSLDNIEKVNEAKISEQLLFNDSALENTELIINDVKMESQFIYDATSCYGDVCNTAPNILTLQYITNKNILMRLAYTYSKDMQAVLPSSNDFVSLINTYGMVRYKINNKIQETLLIDKTPSNYNGNDLFFQIPLSLKQANEAELVIRIRNKEYIYKLK